MSGVGLVFVTGGVTGTLWSTLQAEQTDAPLSLAAEADGQVESRHLVSVAKKIAGVWDEIAAWLSPELFSTLKTKEIERDHSSSFSRARAVLETWSREVGSKATCRRLIQSLCQMGQRAVAAEVFGSELVQLVQPP